MNFENRNKDLTHIHKAADYLSRSLRENLKVFSVDSRNGRVTFLSEAEVAIHCDYEITKGAAHLSNFNIEPVAVMLSEKKISDKVEDSISEFVSSLRENRYDVADTSFDDVINLFEDRSNLTSLRDRIGKHMASFDEKTQIIESEEFSKLEQIKDILISYISENKEKVLGNKDISNSLRVANALRVAFDAPDSNYESLVEGARFTVDLCGDASLYEMICKQELVRQELLEAKEDFSNTWISNDAIQNLASCIYAKDEALQESLKDILAEVPYFAFATKADLNEVFTSVFEVNSTDVVTKKEIKEFTRKLYEWKKPAKEEITQMLDEKYGINVANLKFVPTFSNLARTQSVMFEVLSLISEDNSLVQDISREFSRFIAKKGGVETLVLNDFIVECFEEALNEPLKENLLMQYVDMPRLSRDISALKTLVVGDSAPMGGEMGGEEMEEEVPEEGMEEEVPEEGMEEEVPEESIGQEFGEEGMEEEVPGEEVGEEVPEEGMPEDEEGMPVGDDSTEETPFGGGGGGGGDPQSTLASDLEDLVRSLGLGGEEEEEEDEDGQYEA